MFVFGCIRFTALKHTIDADGKTMQFITIVQIVLLCYILHTLLFCKKFYSDIDLIVPD